MGKNIIIIMGTGGSGKTALAEYIAEKSGFVIVSEDKFWGEYKKGQDWDGFRTSEEEIIIRKQVAEHIQNLFKENKNVVLEFILYCNPPKPLISYMDSLKDIASDIMVAVLNPSAEAIVERKLKRGRENEKNTNLEDENVNIMNWLECIDTPYIKKEWIIDNSNLTPAETYDIILRDIKQTCVK